MMGDDGNMVNMEVLATPFSVCFVFSSVMVNIFCKSSKTCGEKAARKQSGCGALMVRFYMWPLPLCATSRRKHVMALWVSDTVIFTAGL